MANHSLIIGREVDYFGGYGGTDGRGAIVAIRGTPNPAPRKDLGVMRVIRPDDCAVDVILFDGRRIRGVHECGIDAPGIGIKTRPETCDVSYLPELAARREARQACLKAKARAESEAREAARVIANPPVFFWNGIKDKKGAPLQKCSYSDGQLLNFPAGTISIYARNYGRFSDVVRGCFSVQNDTDTQTDYFDNDRIRVIPTHPLYAAVKTALEASRAHFEARRSAK